MKYYTTEKSFYVIVTRGSKDMIDIAKKNYIETYIIDY